MWLIMRQNSLIRLNSVRKLTTVPRDLPEIITGNQKPVGRLNAGRYFYLFISTPHLHTYILRGLSLQANYTDRASERPPLVGEVSANF
jgi:hypothetical protein